MEQMMNAILRGVLWLGTIFVLTVSALVFAALLLMLYNAAAQAEPITNPAVTQETIHATICVPGWTKQARPSAKVMHDLKQRLAAKANITDTYKYELDHIVPLELGGAPLDERNLELEPWAGTCGAKAKDQLEHVLSREVCAENIPLAQAQEAIEEDWVSAYQTYVDPKGCKHEETEK